MATAKASDLERRVAALEAEVARLKLSAESSLGPRTDWWNAIAGGFAGDPTYEEAMRLGREYRESQRPGRKPTKAKPTKAKPARPKSSKTKADTPRVKKG